MRHVGMAKIDLAACKISEIDPYVEQMHLREGYGPSSARVLDEFKPDLIVEEVDDMAVKAQIRRWAARTRTPLIMVSDIGERSVVDVERHDLEGVRPFNGRLSRGTFDRLADGRLDQAELQRVMIKIVGARNLSVRMVKSAALVGKELAGVPQLGSSAAAGAAIATVAARSLLVGEVLKSGSYAMSPRRMLKLGRQVGIGEAFGAFRSLRQAGSGS